QFARIRHGSQQADTVRVGQPETRICRRWLLSQCTASDRSCLLDATRQSPWRAVHLFQTSPRSPGLWPAPFAERPHSESSRRLSRFAEFSLEYGYLSPVCFAGVEMHALPL